VVAAVVVAGVVAAAAIGMELSDGLAGEGGGASSPEAAAQGLADAVDSEDALSALAILPPEEVRQLDEALGTVEDEAGEKGWASSSAPLGGLELDIEGLELSTEELGDSVAKVTATGGTASATVDPADATAPVRAAVSGDLDGTTQTASIADMVVEPDGGGAPIEPFVMTVERNGRWYVSPTYTAMEYLRLYFDLPAGDFDSEPSSDDNGAESPEAVVEQAVAAAEALDVDAAIDLLPPSEGGAAYAYRDALHALVARAGGTQEIRQDFALDVGELLLTTERQGDTARVSIDGSNGSVSWSGEDRYCTYDEEYGDSCYDEPVHETLSWEQDSSCGSYSYATGKDGWGGCLADTSSEQLGPLAVAQSDIGSPYVVTVEEGGRWYLSPVSTIADISTAVLEHWGDADAVERALLTVVLARPELSEPDAAVALGATADGELDSLGLAVLEIEGRLPEDGVACDLFAETTYSSIALGPDDRPRVVVQGPPGDPYSFELMTDYEDCFG
jgi:hypothetical protein